VEVKKAYKTQLLFDLEKFMTTSGDNFFGHVLIDLSILFHYGGAYGTIQYSKYVMKLYALEPSNQINAYF